MWVGVAQPTSEMWVDMWVDVGAGICTHMHMGAKRATHIYPHVNPHVRCGLRHHQPTCQPTSHMWVHARVTHIENHIAHVGARPRHPHINPHRTCGCAPASPTCRHLWGYVGDAAAHPHVRICGLCSPNPHGNGSFVRAFVATRQSHSAITSYEGDATPTLIGYEGEDEGR